MFGLNKNKEKTSFTETISGFKFHFSQNKNTVYELTRRQVKTQYRGSSLGFLWTILNPLLNMLVMWLVFTQFFGRDDPYYSIYLLTGNILFSALQNATIQSLQSIVNNRNLLLRTKIEPRLFAMGNIFTSIVNFLFSLIALVPFMIWLSIQQGINLFSYQLFFILLMLPAFWMFEYGLGLILSVIYVFFRDIKHLYSVFLTLWHYTTPIFYKKTNMKGFANTIINLNPMYQFVSYFRQCVYMGAIGMDAEAGVISEKIPAGASYLPMFGTLGWCYLSGVAMFVVGIAVYYGLKNKLIIRI